MDESLVAPIRTFLAGYGNGHSAAWTTGLAVIFGLLAVVPGIAYACIARMGLGKVCKLAADAVDPADFAAKSSAFEATLTAWAPLREIQKAYMSRLHKSSIEAASEALRHVGPINLVWRAPRVAWQPAVSANQVGRILMVLCVLSAVLVLTAVQVLLIGSAIPGSAIPDDASALMKGGLTAASAFGVASVILFVARIIAHHIEDFLPVPRLEALITMLHRLTPPLHLETLLFEQNRLSFQTVHLLKANNIPRPVAVTPEVVGMNEPYASQVHAGLSLPLGAPGRRAVVAPKADHARAAREKLAKMTDPLVPDGLPSLTSAERVTKAAKP